METKKIAVACFIGGMICSAVALMFAPVYWWFGLIAGMAGGYISYEFREVLEAIQIAWRAVIGYKPDFKLWQRRFFFTTSLTLSAISIIGFIVTAGYLVFLLSGTSFHDGPDSPLFAFLALSALFSYNIPFMPMVSKLVEMKPSNDASEAIKISYWKKTLFLVNPIVFFFYWFPVGVLKTFPVLWEGAKFVKPKIVSAGKILGRFLWLVFVQIHSEKRVLCAIDGTLGGATSYIWLVSASMSFPEQAVLVIFGGFLGAAFGVANWEIVSKRILHVPRSASA